MMVQLKTKILFQAYRQMLTKLSDHYFANATNHFEKSMQYIQLYSDLGYMSSFEEMINYHAQNPCQNTYVYEFVKLKSFIIDRRLCVCFFALYF